MNVIKTLAVGTFLASTLVAGTAFAKAHNNGFGLGAKGTLAGGIDEIVDNAGGGGRDSAYGIVDQREEAMDDVRGNSEEAQIKDETHPSSRSEN
jgi:hypothetical protein